MDGSIFIVASLFTVVIVCNGLIGSERNILGIVIVNGGILTG
jgi:hypothetical protein